jgi:hypothetical protein
MCPLGLAYITYVIIGILNGHSSSKIDDQLPSTHGQYEG